MWSGWCFCCQYLVRKREWLVLPRLLMILVGSRFIIHSYSNHEKYLFLHADEKETVLDGLGGPRTGEQFDRRQSEKEMLEAIQAKN